MDHQCEHAISVGGELEGKEVRWSLMIGVFFISLSVLVLEITLSRIFSVMFTYHYVFMAVSLAVFGIGVGGIVMHVCGERIRARRSGPGLLTFLTGTFALTVSLSIALTMKAPYVNSLLFYVPPLFLPFTLAGMVLSEVFRQYAQQSTKIYTADLVGAAVGTVLVVVLLNWFGGINTGLFVGVVGAMGAMFFAWGTPQRGRILGRVVVLLGLTSGLFGINLIAPYTGTVHIGKNPQKDLYCMQHAPGAELRIVETRWSAFGRTDLVEDRNDPEKMMLFVDGAAGTPMYWFDGNFDNPEGIPHKLKQSFIGYFPFLFLTEEEKNTALIIGAGGGRDVLTALMGGVERITAVEVNGDLVDLVRKYASYNGGIYTRYDNVEVVVAEGRSFLRRSDQPYDVIMLTLPITKSSRSYEGYALTENFLFTVDSIRDYLDHLTPEGRLIVVAHHMPEVLKLVSISLKAFEERGVPNTEAMEHIYTFGPRTLPLFVLKKTKFEPEEAEARHRMMQRFTDEESTGYFPHMKAFTHEPHLEYGIEDEWSIVNQALVGVARGTFTMDQLVKALTVDISPVTDNRPFFYMFEGGLPEALSSLFWWTFLLTALVIMLPLSYFGRHSGSVDHIGTDWPRGGADPAQVGFEQVGLADDHVTADWPRWVALFGLLGIGFMLVEVALIQKFTLFLGQPVLSVVVLLFSLLLGAGAGSFVSGLFGSKRMVGGIASLCVALLTVVYAILLPPLFRSLLGSVLFVRLMVSAGLLMPLGFLMGWPFPQSIKLLKEAGLEDDIPWMWGINGASSVLGSVLTITIAVSLGFTQALIAGAISYLTVYVLFKWGLPRL